jgi:FkbM family methyltransferase
VSWRTSRTALALRNIGRFSGLNRLLIIVFRGQEYEGQFQSAMLGVIRPGDVVWDVGANVGLYSSIFAQIAGPSGRVVAWEPSAVNLQRLNDRVAALSNVTVMPVGLGDREGTVLFEQGDDPLGASSKIIDRPVDPSGSSSVQLLVGDQAVRSGAIAIPNVIKVDTEGYELDVLRGLRQTLRLHQVRAVCVEVHFGILNERCLPNAPADIEQLLHSSGFSVAWSDRSHIVATRTE